MGKQDLHLKLLSGNQNLMSSMKSYNYSADSTSAAQIVSPFIYLLICLSVTALSIYKFAIIFTFTMRVTMMYFANSIFGTNRK